MPAQSIIKKTSVKSIPFTKHFGFRKELNKRVEAYLKQKNKPMRDLPAMYVKTAVVMAWWLGTYLVIMLAGLPVWANALLCISFGLATAGMGFNIMHDAIHGAYSKSPVVNKIMGMTMELLGSSSTFWRQKHNVWHHTYTNIAGLDEDLETQGLLRFSPHDGWKPMHRFQHWYVALVYSIAGLQWLLFRDFQIYFTGKTDEFHVYPKMSLAEKVTFWVGKTTIISLLLVIPMFVFPWYQVIIGFLLMMFTVGIALTTIFQLAHVMDNATFPEPIGEPLHIENEWAVHQIQTTVDFAPGNKLLNWYAGGLNFQVEHHLFPHICHIHYPEIAKIVAQTCTDFGLTYNVIPTWRGAMASHWKILKHLSEMPKLATA